MNYRMIIADDEEMLIRLIRKLGRFEELGIEIVDECRDGEEAYRSILKNRPDFVLTDIQMPLLDGLELIEKVQPDVPETLFVLISGYRYFEYARTAIQLSAVDYLLKPINEDQLNALLERLCRLTDERRRQRRDSESLQSFRDNVTQEKLDAFRRALFSAGTEATREIINAQTVAARYGIVFRHSCYRLLILSYHLPRTTEVGRFSFLDKLNEAACASFGNGLDYWLIPLDGGCMILFNCEQKDSNALSKSISTLFYSCKELHEVFGQFRITFGLSEVIHEASGLPAAAAEARAAACGWLYFNGDQIIRHDQVADMARLPANEAFPESEQRRLRDAMSYLHADALNEAFVTLKRRMNENTFIYPGDLAEIYQRVRATLLEGTLEDDRTKLAEALDATVKDSWTLSQALDRVEQTAGDYIRERQALIEQAGQSPVRKAREYIHRHYADNISLDNVAREAGISANYLSRVFKEITGMGFNEYLTAVRLDESKKLLSDTNLSVHEVAAQVGYTDEKYYSKLFKKAFGIKPTEYRRLYG